MSPWEPAAERRGRIVAAVWRIIHRDGIAAVSLRAVAAEAEMVLGSLRNLYPTRTVLMADAAARLFEGVGARIDSLRFTGDLVDDGTATIAELLPLDRQRLIELEVNLALMAESRSEPALRDIRDAAHREIRTALLRLVAALGVADAEVPSSARRLHALIDGMALQLLHQPAGESVDWAVDEVRRALEQLANPV